MALKQSQVRLVLVAQMEGFLPAILGVTADAFSGEGACQIPLVLAGLGEPRPSRFWPFSSSTVANQLSIRLANL